MEISNKKQMFLERVCKKKYSNDVVKNKYVNIDDILKLEI